QTCALPICRLRRARKRGAGRAAGRQRAAGGHRRRRGARRRQPPADARARLRGLPVRGRGIAAQAAGARSQPAAAAARRPRAGAARAGGRARAAVPRSRRPGDGHRRPHRGRGRHPPGAAPGRVVDHQRGRRMSAARTVQVGGSHPYAISIGPGLLQDGTALATHARGRHVLLVSDSQVAPLYAAGVEAALRAARPELAIATHVIPAGESHKTLATLAGVFDALAALGATRDAAVFALGGGVVGDLAGFAAACWMRGVDCVQLPTTLLSMVDSSVGGKTAVDIPQGKNLVGAFHPPRAVIADTGVLRSLPARELRAGLAEVIKYGCIRDPLFFQWLQAERAALLAGDDAALAQAIARSCEHKAEIVERDPLEKGERALLNLGHTFGHAIETAQGYGAPDNDNLNHGEAVAVGMVLAARLSAALGMADAADTERLRTLLQAYGLPTAIPAGLAPETLLQHMRLDKKNIAGR